MLGWRGIREVIDGANSLPVRDSVEWGVLLRDLERVIEAWQAEPLIPLAPGRRLVGLTPIPPIRRLKSAIEELVSAADRADFDALDLHLCVVVALETCRSEGGGTAVTP
jgi:hypothetical protein